MPTEPSLVDRFTSRIKNNPIVATCIVVGLVVIWLASFTEAIRKLKAAWPDAKPFAIAGQWQSDPMKDVRTKMEFRYVFDLKAEGMRVYGSARRSIPYCEAHPNAGPCEGHDREVAVTDGTLDRKSVVFACDWGELPGAAPWSWIKVKEIFRGSIDNEVIRFVAQDDQNDPPLEFAAARQAAPKV